MELRYTLQGAFFQPGRGKKRKTREAKKNLQVEGLRLLRDNHAQKPFVHGELLMWVNGLENRMKESPPCGRDAKLVCIEIQATIDFFRASL